MAVDIVKILIGLEQIYVDNPVLKDLRIYLQNPLLNDDIEKSVFLLKIIEDNKDFIHHVQSYMLNPLDTINAEKSLPLIKILSESKKEIAHQLKCYMMNPLDTINAEKSLPLIKILNESTNEVKISHQIKCYILSPIDIIESEKLLPLFRIINENYNIDLINQIKYTIINPSDILSIFKVFFLCGLKDPLIINLSKALVAFPELNWNDAFSKGQIFSKLWLIDELKKMDTKFNLELDLGIAYVCAGWLGTLPALILKDGSIKFKYFRSFDIDSTCEQAADTLLKDPYVIKGWQFKSVTKDILDINYESHTYNITNSRGVVSEMLNESCHTIINTSCDHIFPFSDWWNLIPKGKLVILQNNDSKIDDDHVNNINSLEEMKAQAPMRKVFYEGVLNLPDYNRFMLIGVK